MTTDTKTTEQLVDEFLATAGVKFSVSLVGETTQDSRKALQTYTDCCESGRKLRQLFSPSQREALETLLQDY